MQKQNNTVELISYFGDDLMIANTARVSYGKHKDDLDDKDAKLIKYLVDHKHTSPFRHAQLQFRITCPIYVERQLFKHQVGMSANSISGRYVDFSDSYTTIKQWRKQAKNSKQGSEGVIDNEQEASELEYDVINFCAQTYNKLIELGVSKEQARTILPLNLNTTFVWTGSFLSFIHLFNLRLKPDAQAETRQVAAQMLECIKNITEQPFKYSLQAFNIN